MENNTVPRKKSARLLAIAVYHYQRALAGSPTALARFAKWHRLHVQAAKEESRVAALYPCTHGGTLCATCLKVGNSTLGYSPTVVL